VSFFPSGGAFYWGSFPSRSFFGCFGYLGLHALLGGHSAHRLDVLLSPFTFFFVCRVSGLVLLRISSRMQDGLVHMLGVCLVRR
jgi:hypothetical protein